MLRAKLISVCLCSVWAFAQAETEPQDEAANSEIPGVEACIPEPVSKLGPPTPFNFHKGLVTAITALSEEAQLHTLQGLNHLHGGWDFEAMRHFAVAMRKDERCLMAHWGMVMAMLTPSPETDKQRLATTNRLLELIADGEGTELERGFAYALVKYIQEGPAGAAEAFRRVADKYPSDLQAQIFASIFGRTGYDSFGSATPDQEVAERRLTDLIERRPEEILPLHALLLIRAEAPDLEPSRDLARQLCQLAPDYAPYFHVLGHYEWRCGEHAKAASAFARAASLYSIWIKENKASYADCPGWVRAECYRVVALASQGDFDNALASAEKIAGTTLDAKRAAAPGSRRLLWDAKTLPARVLMRRAGKGDAAKALGMLPKPEESAPYRDQSLYYWWVDGLRMVLEAQRLIETADRETATHTLAALSLHGQAMAQRQNIAAAIGEQTEWRSSFQVLETLAAETRGQLALAGPVAGHGSAFNWFRAAADRQRPPTMMNPPLILTPMATRLGDYHLARNEGHKAVAAYQEALKAYPSDQETEERLQKAEALAATQPAPEEDPQAEEE